MATELRPLPNTNLALPRCNVLIGDVGGTEFVDLGDVEALSMELSVEEISRYGRNSGTKQLRKSDVIQVDATLTMTVMDMTKFARALSVGGAETSQDQAAQTGLVYAATGAAAGKIYELPEFDVSNVVVQDGIGAETYVPGVDYIVLEEAGYVQILSVPAAADADIMVTYDCGERTGDNAIFMAGIGNAWNVEKAVKIVSINKIGPRDEITFHRVELRPSGSKDLQGQDDYATLELTGRIYVDPSQPSEFALGYMKEVSAAGAA